MCMYSCAYIQHTYTHTHTHTLLNKDRKCWPCLIIPCTSRVEAAFLHIHTDIHTHVHAHIQINKARQCWRRLIPCTSRVEAAFLHIHTYIHTYRSTKLDNAGAVSSLAPHASKQLFFVATSLCSTYVVKYDGLVTELRSTCHNSRYVFTCMCMYAYMYFYVYVCICLHWSNMMVSRLSCEARATIHGMYIHVCVCMHTCIFTCMCVYVYTGQI